jgi:hypothetical protein
MAVPLAAVALGVAITALTVGLVTAISNLHPLFNQTQAQEEFTKGMIDELAARWPGNRVLIIKRGHSITGQYVQSETIFKLHAFKSVTYQVYFIDNYESATVKYWGDGGFANWCYIGQKIDRNDGTGTLVFNAATRPQSVKPTQPATLPQPVTRPANPNRIINPNNVVAFTSYHRTRLRGAPGDGGKVDLTSENREWERWYWNYLGGDKFTWQSNHGTFLRANPDGRVDLALVAREWEIWRKVPGPNGMVSWISHHGTYLRGYPDGRVDLAKKPKEWELWIS